MSRVSMFICEDGKDKFYVEFFTKDKKFNIQVSPMDYETHTPDKPMRSDNYGSLYDDIHYRMNMGDKIENPKWKQDFMTKYVFPMLRFELVRSKIKIFIDEYMLENPKYIYARIYSR